MTNLFTNLSKNGSEPENGPRMDRHYTENGPIHSRQLFAVLVMLWVKLVNLVNFVMQIFVESLKSLKSLMSNFATYATFASANFVGKESNESTVIYRVKSRIPSCLFRHASVFTSTRIRLASLICLCMLCLGVGEIWAVVQTWDLTTNSYSAATGTLVTWSSTGATMTLAQGSGNAPNGYLGNGSDQTHTRFYKSNVLTFTPASGYSIAKIQIVCTSGDYDDGFESSWTNASKTVSDGVVTVTPTTGTSACYVTLGNSSNANRVTKVSVVYTTGAEVIVADPNYNQLDDDHGYNFGTVDNTSGTVTISLYGSCLLTMENAGDPYLMETFLYGDDASNFAINNTDDYFYNSLSASFTLKYTGLTTNKTYKTALWVYAYKATSCKDYPLGDNEAIYYEIPISVTYNGAASATASPTSWDFGTVGVGQTVTKDFTIATGNLTDDLTVAMLEGDQDMSVSPSSIDEDATSTTVTVTFTPSATGNYEDYVVIDGGCLASSLDINITGTAAVMHEVHWVVNGVDWSLSPSDHGNPTTSVADGTKPSVMPTTPVAGTDGCGDKFMGWTTAEITGSQGSAPTPCWNSLTYFQNVTADITYYAVFADEQP